MSSKLTTVLNSCGIKIDEWDYDPKLLSIILRTDGNQNLLSYVSEFYFDTTNEVLKIRRVGQRYLVSSRFANAVYSNTKIISSNVDFIGLKHLKFGSIRNPVVGDYIFLVDSNLKKISGKSATITNISMVDSKLEYTLSNSLSVSDGDILCYELKGAHGNDISDEDDNSVLLNIKKISNNDADTYIDFDAISGISFLRETSNHMTI